jgi:hypothetical protein
LQDSELRVMGLATASITDGVNGTVMSFGTLKDIDTRGSTASAIAVGDETWAAGDILFAHPTVDGKLTKVRPQHDLVVAFITVRHASAGQLAVRITSGNHLEWLHDVDIEDPTDDQILAYDAATGLWQNIDIPASAGIVASSTAPEETSSIWYNTENGNAYIYYDSFWTSVSGASSTPIISDTAPSSPIFGMQWFNSLTGKTYLYYSGSWIEIDSNGTATQPSGNAIINGAFDIWQRGTSFASGGYTADRWLVDYAGGAGTTSRQTFTPGTAPAAGYEGQFFLRKGATTGAQFGSLLQRIEDVRTFAGQTITLSFWAKGTNPTGGFAANFIQNFGSGGSSQVAASAQTFSLTASWQRFFFTFNIPSISGKTVGTDSYLFLSLYQFASNTSASTLDIWGVQVEAGTVATSFKRNAPSIQAELAACQRYFWRANLANGVGFTGFSDSTTSFIAFAQLPVPMRTQPVFSTNGALEVRRPGVTSSAVTVNPSGTAAQVDLARLVATTASTQVQGQPGALTWSSGTPSIDFNAEL